MKPKQRTNISKGAKDHPFVKFDVSQDRWDSIFGKKEEKSKPGRYVWQDDKFVHEDEVSKTTQSSDNVAPAIHDDRLYKGVYDWGIGRVWNSRTERREYLKANGFECKG
jgi:hypothetical protein